MTIYNVCLRFLNDFTVSAASHTHTKKKKKEKLQWVDGEIINNIICSRRANVTIKKHAPVGLFHVLRNMPMSGENYATLIKFIISC